MVYRPICNTCRTAVPWWPHLAKVAQWSSQGDYPTSRHHESLRIWENHLSPKAICELVTSNVLTMNRNIHSSLETSWEGELTFPLLSLQSFNLIRSDTNKIGKPIQLLFGSFCLKIIHTVSEHLQCFTLLMFTV